MLHSQEKMLTLQILKHYFSNTAYNDGL